MPRSSVPPVDFRRVVFYNSDAKLDVNSNQHKIPSVKVCVSNYIRNIALSGYYLCFVFDWLHSTSKANVLWRYKEQKVRGDEV
jgi:hypothetical protein